MPLIRYTRKLFLSVVIAMCVGNLQAQVSDVDQLKQKLTTARDTAKIKTLISLIKAHIQKDVDQARAYAEWADLYADSVGNVSLKPKTLYYRAITTRDPSGSTQINYLKQGLRFADQVDDDASSIDLLTSLGLQYQDKTFYDSALSCFQKCEKLAIKLNKEFSVAVARANIGNTLVTMNESAKALTYFDQAETSARKLNEPGLLGFLITKKAMTRVGRGEYNRALDLFRESVLLARKAGRKRDEINGMLNIGSAYSDLGNVKMELETFVKVRNLCDSIHVEPEFALWFNLGVGYANLGDFEKALPLVDSLFAIGKRKDIDRPTCLGYCLQATIQRKKGDYAGTIDGYLKALQVADPDRAIRILGELSSFYQTYHESNLSLKYSKMALEKSQPLSSNELKAFALAKLSAHYLSVNNYDSAEYYNDQVVNAYEKMESLSKLAGAILQRALIYASQRKNDQAIAAFEKSLSLCRQIGNENISADVLQGMAHYYQQHGDHKKAVALASEAYQIARRMDRKELIKDASHTLANAYADLGMHAQAFTYLKDYDFLKDSLFNIDKTIEIGRIESKFRIEQQESENELLRKDTDIQLATIQTQQTQLVSLIIGVVMLLLVAVLFYRIMRIRKYTNQKLAQQNKMITDQNEELAAAMEKIQLTQAQLIHSEKMASLGVLSAGIAHELNNPINFVSGGVQALEATLLDFVDAGSQEEKNVMKLEMKDLILSIKSGVERTTTIVSGLNGFSRMENRKAEMNLISSVETTLALLPKTLIEGIELDKQYSDVPQIIGNESQLAQVLLNILTNAMQAIRSRASLTAGIISVRVYKEDHYVVVSVQDNGIGIPKAKASKVFDPFFTTKPVGEGVGLGLSIAYDIIKDHSGTLSFVSEEGEGTTFFVRLPANQQ